MSARSIAKIATDRSLREITESLAFVNGSLGSVGALLREGRTLDAAKKASTSGHKDLAVELFSHIGRYHDISRMRIKDGDIPGAIDGLMEMGFHKSAVRLAFRANELWTVCELTDSIVKSWKGSMDYSLKLVEILLLARDAASIQRIALRIYSGDPTYEMLMAEKSTNYESLIEKVSQDGIGHFRHTKDYFRAAVLALKASNRKALVEIIREGLGYHEQYGCHVYGCNVFGFLRISEVAVGEPKGQKLEDRAELFSRITLLSSSLNGDKVGILSPNELVAAMRRNEAASSSSGYINSEVALPT